MVFCDDWKYILIEKNIPNTVLLMSILIYDLYFIVYICILYKLIFPTPIEVISCIRFTDIFKKTYLPR